MKAHQGDSPHVVSAALSSRQRVLASDDLINIRAATAQDRADVRRIHASAFPESDSARVSTLAAELLFDQTLPQTISLIAETEGAAVGHAAFSPVRLAGNPNVRAYILAPLGVKPDHQKRGIGSKLVEYGLRRLSIMKVNVVLVYGDPRYYSSFGFNADAARQYTPPYPLQYPFGWQALTLDDCHIKKSPAAITCVAALSDPKLW